jgi:hypothetical protein
MSIKPPFTGHKETWSAADEVAAAAALATSFDVPEANCGDTHAALRALAEEGAALHGPGQPERTICDGLLAALNEIKRLRAALWHVQYTAKSLADAQVIALDQKRPNVGAKRAP